MGIHRSTQSKSKIDTKKCLNKMSALFDEKIVNNGKWCVCAQGWDGKRVVAVFESLQLAN